MARAAGSWVALGALAALAAAQPLGCDPTSSGPSAVPSDPTVAAVLDTATSDVILPTLAEFEGSLGDLRVAIEVWRDAIVDGSEATVEREEAQRAWYDAMAVWQRAEVHQVGPSAPSTAVGGTDLRDVIYSWPTTNPCRVDQETVLEQWREPSFVDPSRLVPSYGLDALEHLLYAGPDNVCPNQLPLNAEGTWDAVGPQGIRELRAGYALALVDGLDSSVATLNDAWSQFSLDGGTYGDEQTALNGLYDALFYLELDVKDRKLADPLGLGDCTTDCGELVEGGASGGSVDWVLQNIRGFRDLFSGGDGIGFDDLLTDLGHDDLQAQILTDLDEAEAAFEGLGEPLDSALENDPDAVQAAYDSLKDVTDVLKGDLATVLALQIPAEAGGDND